MKPKENSQIEVFRYPERVSISTHFNKLEDALSLINNLTSSEALIDLLNKNHGFSLTVAKDRAVYILPYIKISVDYLEQAILSTKLNSSLLSTYYAMLNLAKAYILIGSSTNPFSIKANQLHGASYNVLGKKSHKIDNESVKFHTSGVIPQLLQTITGLRSTKAKSIKLDEIIKQIFDVSAEYEMISGSKSYCVPASFFFQYASSFDFITVNFYEKLPKKQVFLLPGFRSSDNSFYTKRIIQSEVDEKIKIYQNIKNSYLILPETNKFSNGRYHSLLNTAPRSVIFPEEVNILLLFLYLSYLVRYRPDLMYRFRDSKYWIIIDAAKRYCLYKFMRLFWSFANKKLLILESV